MDVPESFSIRNPVDIGIVDEPIQGWVTVVRCKKCKNYMYSNGNDLWCEVCGYNKENLGYNTNGNYWSKEDDDYLYQNYKKVDKEILIKKFGREWSAIVGHYHALKKRRLNRGWQKR